MPAFRMVLTAAVVLTFAPATNALRAASESDDGLKFFREKIEPVLIQHCYECHSTEAKKIKGGLRLDSKAAMLAGGDSGSALASGDLKSLLLQAIRHEGGLEMPSDKPKLADNVIADFEQWVKLGAPDSRAGEAPPTLDPKRDPAKARGTYWAFQPLKRPALPAVKRTGWANNPIDRFVLAKLEEHPLPPAPPPRPRRS